jgi:hypothetical protein
MMSVFYTQLGVSKTKKVAAGTMLVGGWGEKQSAPASDTLKAAWAPYGATWTLSYLSYPHVGVTLSRDVTEYEITVALAKANCYVAPGVFAVSGLETQATLEQLGSKAGQLMRDTIDDAMEGASTALWFARYAPWIIAGIIIIALIGIGVLATRKGK